MVLLVLVVLLSLPTLAWSTPVARTNWKVSAGILNMSSRNGTAEFRLPKNVSKPVTASWG